MEEPEKTTEAGPAKKGRTTGDKIVIAVMILVVLWSGFVVMKNLFLPRNLEDSLPPPELSGKDMGALDLDWRVQELGGQAMDMSSVKGKVVVLNFWEHWCPPCRAEIGSIQRLYDAVKGDGILVMPVFQDSAAATRKFLQQQSITMPVYQVIGALPGSVAPSAIPTTVVLDRDGHARAVHVGAARWDDPSVVKFLKGLAGKDEAPPPPTAETQSEA